MTFHHAELAEGGWGKLTLAEQLGNVGSEVGRAARAFQKDPARCEAAAARAFELLDLTIADVRWRKRLKELTRVREVLADALLSGGQYNTSLEDLDRYFFPFVLAARANR